MHKAGFIDYVISRPNPDTTVYALHVSDREVTKRSVSAAKEELATRRASATGRVIFVFNLPDSARSVARFALALGFRKAYRIGGNTYRWVLYRR